MAGRRATLEIPLWAKPASKAPGHRNRKQGPEEIPLWVKPSYPNNIDKYVSTVPLHQTKATRHLVMQRDWAAGQCRWSPRSGMWRQDSSATPGVEFMRPELCDGQELSGESTDTADNSSDQSTMMDESDISDENDGIEAPTATTALFTVIVCDLDGSCHKVDELSSDTQVSELCAMVAEKLGIPDFAVRLIPESSDYMLHMSQPGVSLGMVGISEGSQLTLAQNWGWGKPDVRKLAGLQRQWRQESSGKSIPTDTGDENSVIETSAAATAHLAAPKCESESDRREALVAALRDARLYASARRTAGLGTTSVLVPGETALCCETEDLEPSETALCCKREDIVTAVRHARQMAATRRMTLSAAVCQAAALVDSPVQEDIFTVTLCALDGSCYKLDGLTSSTYVVGLCEMAAEKLDIPDFAVRLIPESSDHILHISQPGVSLGMVGLTEGSQLMLAKNWGWGKPDITKLAELERQWRSGS